MRRERPPVAGVAVLETLAGLAWEDPVTWAAAAAGFAAAAEAQPAADAPLPRCRVALLGSPPLWPHFVVPRLIEESGAAIVAEESCGGSRASYDTVYVDDPSVAGMTRAVADRYLLPCACPCFVPNDDRLFRLRAMVEDARPDGAVYYVLKSCYVYDAEFESARRVLEDLGVRTLRVESDYSSASTEQLRTRLETFVEMLAPRTPLPPSA
jgi:benzoyl-CoA reductase/2-hydroxyglutaryl-CoA dehydratase subunit BcrC/BadD/HgdB